MNKVSFAVIGMGNDYRRDDGAGLYISRIIEKKALANTRVISGVSDGTSLMEAWQEADAAYVIDCTCSGASPGHIYRFDALNETVPEEYFTEYSTHAFSVKKTVELAGVLGKLPSKLIIYGIEGVNFSAGNTLSEEVKVRANELADIIISEIMELTGKNNA